MTRLASIMGVAAVATLVLLSGCETPMKTDYAKDLAGTWSTTLMGVTNPMPPPPTVPGTTAVTANVSRTGTNKGSVSLTITGTPAVGPASTTEVTGTIEVTATKIMVSEVDVMPPEAAAAIPGGAAALAQLELTYKLSDDGNELTAGNSTIFPVLLGTMEIKLAKDTSGNSGG